MTTLSLFALIASLAFLAACIAAEMLGWVWYLCRTNEVHPWALTAPGILRAIPGMGLVVALISLLPSVPWKWLEGLCACEAFGGLHLCPFHVDDGTILVLLLSVAAALLLLRRLPAIASSIQRTRDLEHIATVDAPEAEGPVLIDCGGRPIVFVAGVRRPRVVVERTWWARLDDRARKAIAAHERAHIEARDPQTVAMLDLLLTLFAPRIRPRILADWTLATEMRADAKAAEQDGDPVFVAQLLCRHAGAGVPTGALGLGHCALEARVRSLLDGKAPSNAKLPFSAYVGVFLVACGAGHLVHSLLEALLPFLSNHPI